MIEESGRNDRGARTMLMIFSTVMVLIAVGTGVLLYRIIAPPPKEEARQCEGDKSSACAEGEMCIRGQCVAWDQPVTKCQSGQSCDSHCTCASPFACRGGVCIKVTDANRTPSDACGSPGVQTALKQLVVTCESAGGRGVSCDLSKWKDFVINDARFDEIMTNFPGAMTIHFPAARPNVTPGAEAWPPPGVRAHYLDEVRKRRAALDAAKLIFLVGRASKGGPPQQNIDLGFARMGFARSLLRDLYKDPEAREALEKKVLNFTLGETRQLPSSFYAAHLAGQLVTWDDESLDRLTNAIQHPAAITDTDRWWAVNVVNQVAFLIPVPCDGGDVIQ